MDKTNLFLVDKSAEYFHHSGNGRVLYNHFLNWCDENLEISDDSSVHHLVREMVILKIIERFDADYIYYATSIVKDIVYYGGYSNYLKALDREKEKKRDKLNLELGNARLWRIIAVIGIVISIASLIKALLA
ncbi:MAG: hypothetical protein ABJH05_11710 [Fulvivirga sp.]